MFKKFYLIYNFRLKFVYNISQIIVQCIMISNISSDVYVGELYKNTPKECKFSSFNSLRFLKIWNKIKISSEKSWKLFKCLKIS